MQTGIRYKVIDPHSGQAFGHFLDGVYYEPFGSDQRLGHIDNEGTFFYYLVKSGEIPKVRGRYSEGKLVRDDGVKFFVEADA